MPIRNKRLINTLLIIFICELRCRVQRLLSNIHDQIHSQYFLRWEVYRVTVMPIFKRIILVYCITTSYKCLSWGESFFTSILGFFIDFNMIVNVHYHPQFLNFHNSRLLKRIFMLNVIIQYPKNIFILKWT